MNAENFLRELRELGGFDRHPTQTLEDAFDYALQIVALERHQAERHRIKDEWREAGRPLDLETFIRAQTS